MVETKGGLFDDAIKPTEKTKKSCGKKYFEAIDTGVKLEFANTFDNLVDKINT